MKRWTVLSIAPESDLNLILAAELEECDALRRIARFSAEVVTRAPLHILSYFSVLK